MELFRLVALLLAINPEVSGNLNDIEDFIEQNRFSLKKKHRPHYHISAPIGWLDSPAAFTYFHNRYHVFYQFYPYKGTSGAVHWGHMVSEDLVRWVYYPTTLIPKEYYEKKGCLSGSAFENNGYLTIFYSGTEILPNNRTTYSQNVAISSDGVIFQKYLYNPLIRESPLKTVSKMKHPKVWKYGEFYYMILGSSSPIGRGRLLIYSSPDMYTWNPHGVLAESYGDMGDFWEFPDLVSINGTHLLIISVHGIQSEEYRFKNSFQTGYVTGRFNYYKLKFEDLEISTQTFHELDRGHDFYAARTLHDPDGRVLLIAWLGMHDSETTQTKERWAQMLTLVRELKLTEQGTLLMNPVAEMVRLRNEVLEEAWYQTGESFVAGTKYFELLVNTSLLTLDASLSLEWEDSMRFTVTYSAEHGYVMVDRGGLDGVRRADWSPVDALRWRIFVDVSSVEVYCGSGEVVLSSRIYPKSGIQIRNTGEAQLHITQYKLTRGSTREDMDYLPEISKGSSPTKITK